jgi:hypothetical protein
MHKTWVSCVFIYFFFLIRLIDVCSRMRDGREREHMGVAPLIPKSKTDKYIYICVFVHFIETYPVGPVFFFVFPYFSLKSSTEEEE